MKKRILTRFTVIMFIIGLMTAIQYNTINEPDIRDTRDAWEIRQELARENQLQSELLSEISSLDDTLGKYEAASDASPEQALRETAGELRKAAGLAETVGPGIEVLIEPSLEAVAMGLDIEGISPDLLIRLVNEINRFNGLYVSIDGKRIINTTAIRDINGQTTVNTKPVDTPPFSIKIISKSLEDSEKLYNHLLASRILDDFYIDNLTLTVSEPQTDLVIEAYDGAIDTKYLQASEGE
ncbi:DUF881 domain-containing protein [Microbacterium sp. APC 3898]|uniref:DUF881 domain-containing protein n=2 Tax=Planococcus TaxID=1372 RepID=A0ABT7ZFZ3_9BACL|nr:MULTISPECIES: DUF881 domain-containing protein [Terrabacteria group]MBD8013773.1 DUF881 domain-containing protein [Planococcus wigleyi]MDN3426076.1 DUF881 domain-containing protein [Planococcus sp. APC 4016]MDN3437670.1 DUF881 domain-containing protein [Planococcus sp. APC 3900]MDN3497773.1 DUF881 domain-containing protein [Microbacterium sp. APC 3898]